MSCPLRKCQGKRGCLCPSKPPPFVYSKTTDKDPTLQPHIPITKHENKRLPPKYIGEHAPISPPVSRVKNSPKKTSRVQSKESDSHDISSRPTTSGGTVKAITAKLPQSASKRDLLAHERDTTVGNNSAEAKETDNSQGDGPDIPSDVSDGNVKINYNHYKKEFPIVKGSLTSEAIDSEYCLTFAFPNSKIHLSTYSPNDFSYEDKGLSAPPLEKENPVGTYQGLRVDTVYWVHLEEDKNELEAYHKRQEKFAEEAAAKQKQDEENEARGLPQISSAESCSCIEGNPCMDRYGCKDWENRYEVAKRNGWKGKFADLLEY
jgi:hypothetical protein